MAYRHKATVRFTHKATEALRVFRFRWAVRRHQPHEPKTAGFMNLTVIPVGVSLRNIDVAAAYNLPGVASTWCLRLSATPRRRLYSYQARTVRGRIVTYHSTSLSLTVDSDIYLRTNAIYFASGRIVTSKWLTYYSLEY